MNLLLLFCNICIYDFACFVAHFGFARWIIKVKQNYKNLYVISSLWETHYILSPILNGLPNKVWLASKKSALIKIHEWINKTNLPHTSVYDSAVTSVTYDFFFFFLLLWELWAFWLAAVHSFAWSCFKLFLNSPLYSHWRNVDQNITTNNFGPNDFCCSFIFNGQDWTAMYYKYKNIFVLNLIWYRHLHMYVLINSPHFALTAAGY